MSRDATHNLGSTSPLRLESLNRVRVMDSGPGPLKGQVRFDVTTSRADAAALERENQTHSSPSRCLAQQLRERRKISSPLSCGPLWGGASKVGIVAPFSRRAVGRGAHTPKAKGRSAEASLDAPLCSYRSTNAFEAHTEVTVDGAPTI